MRRGKACAAAAFSALAILSAPAEAKKPRDDFFNPQPPGTYLRLFGFFGPGFRGILDNRIAIEPDMSELQTQLIGDVNPGFSEASLNADLRFFLLSFGGGVGFRNDWHVLQFSPDGSCDTTEPCDHRETELNRKARWLKDHDYDWGVKRWPWYEGRFRILAPMYQFMGVSTTQFRYQDRGFASCDEKTNPDCIDQRTVYDWQNATVFRDGFIVVNETFLVLRSRDAGFIGPAFRVLNVPRGTNEGNETREWEVHYGVLGGTQVGPGNRDTVLLRIYTTFGMSEDLMGTHSFRAPIQLLLGYQANISLF